MPERFELGTPPYESLAGVTAAVHHLASLSSLPDGGAAAVHRSASPTRLPEGGAAAVPDGGAAGAEGDQLRDRVLASMAAVQEHEQDLFAVLLAGLDSMAHVHTYGRAASRTATAYFTVAGHNPRAVAEHLASRKINAWSGHNYAWELTGVLGIRDAGSAVRVGLVHYNDAAEVDRFLTAVAELGR